jgi:molybdopterin synthase sulfur carrier subunit
MRVQVRYFASLRESLGVDVEWVDLPDDVTTAGGLRDWLSARGGVWSEQMAASRPVRIAVAQQMANPQTLLSEGREVAFFPPVTGG